MKKLITICAVVIMMLAVSGVARAAIQTYSIVDYPAYQIDTVTGLVDHVSGTIMADPTTGLIASASFTITAGNGGASYTVASALTGHPVSGPNYFIHVTPTEILVTPNNPSNPLGYGDLRLYGSTGVSAPNDSAVLQWYTPGDPWVPGSNNWAAYMGTVGSKGSGPLFASDHDATPFTDPNGSRDTMVVATVVPEPPPTEVWVDDDYCEICSNDGHTWGYDAFAVIQQGINAVADSGKVNVAEGRYDSNETFPISINKTLRLLGPQANVDPRPIKCGGRTGSEAIIDANETTDAVIQISASDVEINGFTITGGKKDMVEENGSADNLLFQYNILYDDIATAGDEAIQIMYSNGVIIQYNYAYNIVQDAFNLSASSNGVVRYNEAHDIYSENAAIYCYETNNIDIIGNLVYRVYNNDIIKLGDDGDGSTGGIVKDNVVYDGVQDGITIYATGVTVRNNTIYNCDSENGALYLDNSDNTTIRGNKIYNNDAIGLLIDHSSNVTVEENRIYDNNDTNDTKYPGTAGIWLTSDSNAATITINDNIIYGNAEFGIRNDDDANVNAENNCWGDPNGPYHPVTNPDAVGNAVSDHVDFQPWLLACCGDPGHPYPVGDLNKDCRVNFYDFAVFASAWLSNQCDEHWNPDCNLELSDNVIDTLDLSILADHWLECTME